MKTKTISRRHVLRGAGVALTLPWLESLEPRRARGQSVAPIKRFVPIYFPFGAADGWAPQGTGAGAAWQLSPILEPLTPVKNQVTILGRVDQTAYGTTVAPGVGPLTGSFLTCTQCATSSDALGNNISIDQRIAQVLAVSSLQLGLANVDGDLGGAPTTTSRSISWSGPNSPQFKLIDPQNVFDVITSRTAVVDPAAQARARKQKSIVDFVLGNATDLAPRLGRTDRARMDQFLTSVRDLEQRVAAGTGNMPNAGGASCQPVTRPTLSVSGANVAPLGYDRDAHADVMIDLIVMALSCDVARVVSFMLDDASSAFPYSFLKARAFTETSSTPGPNVITDTPMSAANAGGTSDAWATIDWWYVSKVAALCQKLAAIDDGDGATLLDNSLVWFGSGQQGGAATNLPLLYVGSAGGALPVNRSFTFAPSQRLSNVYLTFLRAFGLADAAFGDSTGIVTALET